MPLKEHAAAEIEKIKHMSWKDRLWYIWEYYKFHLLGIALAIAAISITGNMLYRQSFTTRLTIAIINDQSGGNSSAASLESGLREALQCTNKDLIEINEGLHVTFDEDTMSQYGYASLAKISALVASNSLDVVITDESALKHYASLSAFQNLEEFLPSEFLDSQRDRISYAPDADGHMLAVGLSLAGTSVTEEAGIAMDPPYLAIIGGSPHKEAALRMIHYLFP